MTAGGAAGAEGAGAGLPRVDVADIEAVVSAWTGIDVQRLGQDEKSRLLQLAAVLEARGDCTVKASCLMMLGAALCIPWLSVQIARVAAVACLAPAGAQANGKGQDMALHMCWSVTVRTLRHTVQRRRWRAYGRLRRSPDRRRQGSDPSPCGPTSSAGVRAQECIIGQTEAVRALARAMWRARTGLKDPRRPIAAMLFAGGTGVGKTETTKARARGLPPHLLHPHPGCHSVRACQSACLPPVDRAVQSG